MKVIELQNTGKYTESRAIPARSGSAAIERPELKIVWPADLFSQ